MCFYILVNWRLVIGADDVVQLCGYCDRFVTMCVCGCVHSHDRMKTPDWSDLKLGTVVVIDHLLKTIDFREYYRGADEKLCNPPPRCNQEPCSSHRWGWKTPNRTSWWCTAYVCSSGALLGDFLG